MHYACHPYLKEESNGHLLHAAGRYISTSSTNCLMSKGLWRKLVGVKRAICRRSGFDPEMTMVGTEADTVSAHWATSQPVASGRSMSSIINCGPTANCVTAWLKLPAW